jgi:hypothetical protein
MQIFFLTSKQTDLPQPRKKSNFIQKPQLTRTDRGYDKEIRA